MADFSEHLSRLDEIVSDFVEVTTSNPEPPDPPAPPVPASDHASSG